MNYRRTLIRLLTFLGGLYFFLDFVLPPQLAAPLDRYNEQVSNGFITIGSMAVGLGLINLFLLHGSKILFRRKGFPYSLALLTGLLSMIVMSGADWRANERINRRARAVSVLHDFSQKIKTDYEQKTPGVLAPGMRNQKLRTAVHDTLNEVRRELQDNERTAASSEIEDSVKQANYRRDLLSSLNEGSALAERLQLVDSDVFDFAANEALARQLAKIGTGYKELLVNDYRHSLTKHLYELFFDGLFIALGSAMFALLGFYIAAAAYRAFKIRSAESALMMTAAVVVMLGQIPFGAWIWERLPAVRLWLLEVPNAAAFRAIGLGAAVAGLIMAFRMWFSLESESFTDEGK